MFVFEHLPDIGEVPTFLGPGLSTVWISDTLQ